MSFTSLLEIVDRLNGIADAIYEQSTVLREVAEAMATEAETGAAAGKQVAAPGTDEGEMDELDAMGMGDEDM